MTGDQYRIVTANVRKVYDNYIVIERPNAQGTTTIPRSLIHYSDDKIIALTPFPSWREGVGRDKGIDMTFRLREWKAEELGLA